MNKYKGFDLKAIEKNFKHFQKNFDHINDNLEMRREDFTKTIISQLMEGYEFLNSLWSRDIDLFSLSGLYNMLELNHIVLCGTDKRVRREHYQHLETTRKNFQSRIQPIYDWYKRNALKHNPYKIAAQYYGQALSFPQLFFEGNHRTENMIVNYYLLNKGLPPYIIHIDTAIEYLNVSSRIKFSDKDKMGEGFKRIKHTKDFRKFIETHGNNEYLKE
ncbi:hypothetical protein [Spirochaeta cellobiosiphila]|uniref:hypothetical protein n=1 Tax=Spirochaeta cellobiosiphila TaxID=504483 RepID=UPI0003F7A1C8|nr:hypothetical protein [Spirochaeta cellobiosiphila]